MNHHADYHFRRWKHFAPLGLLLIGAGLSLLIDAGIYKSSGAPPLNWIAYGTGGLIVFNAGISVFGESILERARYERKAQKRTETTS